MVAYPVPPEGTADLEKDSPRPGIFSLTTGGPKWGHVDSTLDLEEKPVYETEGN